MEERKMRSLYSGIVWWLVLVRGCAGGGARVPRDVSHRIENTEPPYIEQVLDKYAHLNLTNLALGFSHWGPPTEALERTLASAFHTSTHRYGAIAGDKALLEKIRHKLEHENGLDMSEQEIIVTNGANEAFSHVCLSLLDPHDTAVIFKPYYFSHVMAMQIADARVHTVDFDPSTLLPNVESLLSLSPLPRMVVITSPGNPSGVVWPYTLMHRVVEICKQIGAWIVLDETYEQFVWDGHAHTSVCAMKVRYDKIIHIHSFSKAFGIPGWRVGYLVFPKRLLVQFRKVQDALPTHASIISQKLALACMEHDEAHFKNHNTTWVKSQVHSLTSARAAVWEAVKDCGTVRSNGAFYFLVPVPSSRHAGGEVAEEEAVDILAREFSVLVMPGSAFGARGYLRVSYGSLPASEVQSAARRLQEGLALLKLKAAGATVPSEDL